MVMSIAADFNSCGMTRAGGYDLFFALQLKIWLKLPRPAPPPMSHAISFRAETIMIFKLVLS